MAIITEDEAVPPKKSSLIPMVGAVVLLSLVGAGGGWLTGSLLVPAPKPAEPEAQAPAAEGGHGEASAQAVALPNLLELSPILTNLGYPAENMIRLQVALVFDGTPDPAVAETVSQNIMTYLRTVSLQQLQGPRGFTYLKSDLQEIAGLRSQGRVTKVLVRTFVVE